MKEVLSLLGLPILMLGCLPADGIHFQARGVDSGTPELGNLKSRIDALYAAEQMQSWRTWYYMTPPSYRERASYEVFLRELGSQNKRELVAWRYMEIRSQPAEPQGTPREAIVSMKLTVRQSGTEEFVYDEIDFWIFIGGEWYWRGRGESDFHPALSTG